jgi:hypothetical protein
LCAIWISRQTNRSSAFSAASVFFWSGQAISGLPPIEISAFTCPSPGNRISSGSAEVGRPQAASLKPRTRSFSP